MWVFILLGVLLILTALVNLYAVIEVSYISGRFEYHIKYGFIDFLNNTSSKPKLLNRLLSRSENKKSKKGKKSSPVKDDKQTHDIQSSKKDSSSVSDLSRNQTKKQDSKAKEEKDGRFDDLLSKISDAFELFDSSKKHFGRLIKGISFHRLYVNFCVREEDAYECALSYGRLSTAVYNIAGYITTAFRVKKKDITVSNEYCNGESVYDFACRIRLRFARALTVACGILLSYIFRDENSEPEQRNTKENNVNSNNNLNNTKECLFMNDHPVQGLMGTTIEKLRDMIDVNTIIGEPISTKDGTTIIPVSKVTFGFASGGSDLPTKQTKELFGGGSGAGMSIQPLAFICVSPGGEVKLLQMSVNASKENAIINTVPDLIDKISDLVTNKKKAKGDKEDSKKAD